MNNDLVYQLEHQNKVIQALRQPSQKFWPKILTAYFFTVTSTYTSKDHAVKIFQNCMYSFRENWEINLTIWDSFFLSKQFWCPVDGIRKLNLLSKMDISKTRISATCSCLKFQWNRNYFSSSVLRLHGWLLMVPWHGFHL